MDVESILGRFGLSPVAVIMDLTMNPVLIAGGGI